MNIQLSTREIEDCLIYINRMLSRTKSVIAKAAGVQFLFKNNILKLYCSNGTQTCEVTFGKVDCLDFTCVVEFSTLFKIISLSESGDLTFEFNKDSVFITSDKNEYTLSYLSGKDHSLVFSDVPVDSNPFAVLNIEELQKAVTFLSFCLPNIAALIHFRGINLDGNLTSTNTHAFAFYNLNEKVKESIFLSVESFSLIAGLEAADETVSLYKAGNCVLAIVERAKYLLTIMANKFPNYSKIVQRLEKHIHFVSVDKNTLIKSCKKLTSFVDKYKKNAAKITITQDTISIEAFAETKKGKEVIDIETDTITEEITFFVNLVDFIGYSNRVTDAAVVISFGSTVEDYAIRDEKAWFIDRTLIM